MNLKSIRSHLKPYSISAKRRTTVAHAFASALAPCDKYDETRIADALTALGQSDLEHLTCVYCGHAAETWDHLENLVKAGQLNGRGHQIGNLVPSCRNCNSEKGGKSFLKFVSENPSLSDAAKTDLILRLEQHLALAKPVASSNNSETQEVLRRFFAVRDQILELMREADEYAAEVRSGSDG